MRRVRACLVPLVALGTPALADLATISTATATPRRPVAASDTIAAMLAAAYRTGDDATINAVVGVAKATFPDEIPEIDRLAAGNAAVLASSRREEQLREQARIAAATFFEIWKGELEFGASRSTGSSHTSGLYASAKLSRDGLRWRQTFAGRIDYQRTDGDTTTNRMLVAYQPNYKWNENIYSYGLAQYERDHSLGYSNRGTIGAGIGVTALKSAAGRLDLEGGPALRQTDFVGQEDRTTVAARASLSARFALTPTLSFSQDASLFVEAGDTTAASTTAIDTRLIGKLKARLSYNVQYEQDNLGERNSLDTIGRATLVYSF